MPFTFSHIGYILPIKHKWKNKLSSTGLILGSLAPDYDILFRLTNFRFHLFQYNIITILLIIFPLALLSSFMFHFFCRNIIIEHLSQVLKDKYAPLRTFQFCKYFKKNYVYISASVIIAILIHLCLDYMCHFIDAYRVKIFILDQTESKKAANFAYLFSIYSLPVLFSIAGFYLIYLYEFRDISLQDIFLISKPDTVFWIIVTIITFLLTFIKLYLTKIDTDFYIDYIIISFTSSALLSLFTTCLLFYLLKRSNLRKT